MTNFKTEIERIEKGCGNWDDTTLVQCERECNHKHLCQICQEQKQQLLTDMKIVEDAINKYILTDMQGNPLPECKILWEIKQKLGLNHSQQETQEKGEIPISLARELDNGEYAKKSLSEHNPADNNDNEM